MVVNNAVDAECRAVPVEMARYPPVRIELLTVGIAVPVAIFHTSKLIVPVSTVMLKAAMVQLNGTVKYVTAPVVSADPPPSNPPPMERMRLFELGVPEAVTVATPPDRLTDVPVEKFMVGAAPLVVPANWMISGPMDAESPCRLMPTAKARTRARPAAYFISPSP